MNTRSIQLTVGHQDQDDSWEEEWQGYYLPLTEEDAIKEIEEVLYGFNNRLHPGQKPREAISFVLGPIVDSKGEEIC